MQAQGTGPRIVEEFVVVDVETTGLSSATDKVVEVAALRFKGGRWLTTFHTYVNPLLPIGPETAKIHHLTDGLVADAPFWYEVRDELLRFVGDALVVAHNAPFDAGFLPELRFNRWLCTYRLARHLWPECAEHSNQYLRYWLNLGLGQGTRLSPHSAVDDALVTGHLFLRELEVFHRENLGSTLDHLMELVESPIHITHMPVGKHRGEVLGTIPTDYLLWFERDARIAKAGRRTDPDLISSIQVELITRANPMYPLVPTLQASIL